MCQNQTLLESPNFPQFGWLSNGANWVGKVKQTKSLSLWFFFFGGGGGAGQRVFFFFFPFL